MNNGAELGKKKAAWFGKLLLRALPVSRDLPEALAAVDAAMSIQPEEPLLETFPIGTYLSRDIFNRHAQGILNRAMKAAKQLSAQAQRDLKDAIRPNDPWESAKRVVAFISRYRQQLADLLGTTNLASLLSGAQEVAKHLPVVPQVGGAIPPPPTLPPDEAVKLLDLLRPLEATKREEKLYQLPPEQQAYARQALSRGESEPPSPPIRPTAPPEGSPEEIHFPIIEAAVKELSEKNVVTRQTFDRLDAAARQKAFTVAGVDARETLERIRDALSENVQEGADYEAFRDKILASVDEGTFLSEPHLEVVFRNNVQSAFSDGQMGVLKNPFVRGGFPYAAYEAIHDDRVRHNHLALEKHGIGQSNIYRIDDPVFETFRPPWDFSDRCSWIPYTVRMAAEAGVKEAQTWLDSGVEPSPKAFVPMPPFQPPPGFRRDISSAPFSIRLSMEPLLEWDEVYLGLVGDEWHGPKPPGEGWARIADGPRGGARWKRSTGNVSNTKKPQPRQRGKTGPQPQEIAQKVQSALSRGSRLTDDDVKSLTEDLMKMRVSDINAIKKQLGVSASGNKAELAKKVAERALTSWKRTLPPSQPKTGETAPSKIDANAPVAQRIAQYKAGDAKVDALASFYEQAEQAKDLQIELQNKINEIHDKQAQLKSRRLGKKDNQLLQQLYQKRAQIDPAIYGGNEQARQLLKGELAPKNPAKVSLTIEKTSNAEFTPGTQKAIARAHDFVNGLVGNADGLVLKAIPIPADDPEQRAHYGQGNTFAAHIEADKSWCEGTTAHEFGHYLEEKLPGAHEACVEFLKYRIGNEQPFNFAQRFPDSKYRPSEQGCNDKFDKVFPYTAYYAGKIYPGNYATEILSMGLEQLYNGPAMFASVDPEYCKFVLGILDGSLRKQAKT